MSKATKHIFWLALTAACLVLIWGNSCLTGEESGELSGGLMEWISHNIPWLISRELVLRKLAHFTEFALLGFSVAGTARSFGLKGSLGWMVPLFGVLFCACVDETIQIFVPDRGSSLIDVWIDFGGGCTGTVALACLKQLWNRRKL